MSSMLNSVLSLTSAGLGSSEANLFSPYSREKLLFKDSIKSNNIVNLNIYRALQLISNIPSSTNILHVYTAVPLLLDTLH